MDHSRLLLAMLCVLIVVMMMIVTAQTTANIDQSTSPIKTHPPSCKARGFLEVILPDTMLKANMCSIGDHKKADLSMNIMIIIGLDLCLLVSAIYIFVIVIEALVKYLTKKSSRVSAENDQGSQDVNESESETPVGSLPKDGDLEGSSEVPGTKPENPKHVKRMPLKTKCADVDEESSNKEKMKNELSINPQRKLSNELVNCSWFRLLKFRSDKIEIFVDMTISRENAKNEVSTMLHKLSMEDWLNKYYIKQVESVTFSFTPSGTLENGDTLHYGPRSHQQPCCIGAFVDVGEKGVHILSTGHGQVWTGDPIFTSSGDCVGECAAMKVQSQPDFCDAMLISLREQPGTDMSGTMNVVRSSTGDAVHMGMYSGNSKALEDRACVKFENDLGSSEGMVNCTYFAYHDPVSGRRIENCLSIEVPDGSPPFSADKECGKVVTLQPDENNSAKAIGLIFGVIDFKLHGGPDLRYTLATPIWRALRELSKEAYCRGSQPRLHIPTPQSPPRTHRLFSRVGDALQAEASGTCAEVVQVATSPTTF